MAATVIDGKAVAAEVRERVAADVERFAAERDGDVPGLATVLVGEDPASHVYVANKRRQTEEVGMRSIHHELGEATPTEELLELIAELNAYRGGRRDPGPVAAARADRPGRRDLGDRSAAKDVDGLTAGSAGLLAQGRPGLVPCTPQGVMELLRHGGTDPAGAEAVVIGRSILVGRPLAALLTERERHGHRVPLAHARPRGGLLARRHPVAAVGSPRMVTADMVKPGATVIDVGTNRTDDGLVGDVDFESVSEVAGAITPVPGGVGPMTIAMLLANTVAAAFAPSAVGL